MAAPALGRRGLPLVRARRALAIVASALASSCASAATEPMPDDVAEDAIIGGAATDGFPDVGRVTSGCTATLIHPRAMLTAAHCCVRPGSCRRVSIGGRTVSSRAENHPEFAIAETGAITPSVDVSVLVLDEAVTDIAPRRLATARASVGRRIRFVGFGCTALGGGGSGVKRTGTNAISIVGSDSSGGDTIRFRDVFGWRFEPSEAQDGGTPSYDANICPGDSGGPTLWVEDGELVLAGVHSLVGSRIGYSCHVPARAAWIRERLAALAEETGLRVD